MTEELHQTIPAAQPVQEPLDVQMVRVRRVLEGYIDDSNTRHPGMVEMLTELYEDAKLRRERTESFTRAIASGGVLAILGIVGAWLKDHLKF